MVLDVVGLTGSTGVLGKHIKAVLKNNGLKVIENNRHENHGENSWNLTEWCTDDKFREFFPNVQAIVHAGAIVPKDIPVEPSILFLANTTACLNLGLWALSNDVPLIYISGGISYYNPHAIDIHEEAELGWSGLGGSYGLSKLLGEDSLRRLRQRGLKLSIVRASSIYGAGMSSTKIISKYIKSAVHDAEIKLFPPVEDTVDLIHAYDVSSAVCEILKKKKWTDFNIASGNMISFYSLANTCVELFGGGKVAVAGGNEQADCVKATFNLNFDKAKTELDWSPKVDLKLGLEMVYKSKYLPSDLQR